MITFKAIVISNHRRKDGTYPVKIRVTFKGVSRRLATNLTATQNDLTRSLRIKSPDILNKSDELISRMRKAVSDISPFDLESRDVDWVVARIKDRLQGNAFRLDFFEWADIVLKGKKPSTRANYVSALQAFRRFLCVDRIDINAISRPMLIDFILFVDNEPKLQYDRLSKEFKTTHHAKTKSASTRYVSMLSYIFNAARDRYNDEEVDRLLIPRMPFAKLPLNPIMPKGQKNLGVELMQRIISAQPDSVLQRRALDAFVISFGLMGANMADLYDAAPPDGVWIYNRSKTRDRRTDRAEMRVFVPDELRPYLDRMKGDAQHWLLLSRYSTQDVATRCINRGLKAWCDANDVPPFTFYAARHTWATLARKAGVEKATVDECLCHLGDYELTDIYAERSWELMRDANRKVLDLFEW